jgi:primosomal protein N''
VDAEWMAVLLAQVAVLKRIGTTASTKVWEPSPRFKGA